MFATYRPAFFNDGTRSPTDRSVCTKLFMERDRLPRRANCPWDVLYPGTSAAITPASVKGNINSSSCQGEPSHYCRSAEANLGGGSLT